MVVGSPQKPPSDFDVAGARCVLERIEGLVHMEVTWMDSRDHRHEAVAEERILEEERELRVAEVDAFRPLARREGVDAVRERKEGLVDVRALPRRLPLVLRLLRALRPGQVDERQPASPPAPPLPSGTGGRE